MHHYLAAAILFTSLTICVYMLTIMWHIHHIHSSKAWKFIFVGLSLLAVECAVGAHLALLADDTLNVEQMIFIAIMLAKAICYAIGFTIWKHDIDWLKTLAKQRRESMMEDDTPKPGEPEHPQPPASPPPQPQDEPQPSDPGVPDDPGKSSQHP